MKRNKLLQFILLALLGLTLVGWPGVTPALKAQTITGTNVIASTDFDTTIPGWDYGYFYSWGWPDPPPSPEPGSWLVNRAFTDESIDPTNGPVVLRYEFTNANYQQLCATNAGAGYGTGFGAPQIWGWDPSVFNNLYETNYLFDFDARVEGLTEGVTTADGEMQVQIQASGALILQKNIGFNVGSNWTHFAFTLDDGGFGESTTWANFTNNLANISDVRFNVNFHMPHPAFGWDDYNVVLLDNLKLSVVQFEGAPPPPPPRVHLTILDVNLDDKPGWGFYGGYNWSQNAYLPLFTYSASAPGYGVGGSNGWFLQMDNTALAPPNTPQWAGGGMGGGGPVDFSQFKSGDLRSYTITFDSRAEGLSAPDITTTCALQLFLDSPNGNLRLDFPVPAGSNWVTTTYNFNQGSAGIGSKAAFGTNYNTYTALRTQWQIENATSADWGFDTDNVLVIDNLKIEYLAISCPPLAFVQEGNNMIVTWAQPSTGTAKLQSATNVQGPYTDVVGATSPHTNSITGPAKYFRTAWIPPTP